MRRWSSSSNVKFEFKAHKAFKIFKWGQPQTSCLRIYSASKSADAWGSSISGSESAEVGRRMEYGGWWMVDGGWWMVDGGWVYETTTAHRNFYNRKWLLAGSRNLPVSCSCFCFWQKFCFICSCSPSKLQNNTQKFYGYLVAAWWFVANLEALYLNAINGNLNIDNAIEINFNIGTQLLRA